MTLIESKNHIKNIEIDSEKSFSFSSSLFDQMDDAINDYHRNIAKLQRIEITRTSETSFICNTQFQDGRSWVQSIDYTKKKNPRCDHTSPDFFTFKECKQRYKLLQILIITIDTYIINTMEVVWA